MTLNSQQMAALLQQADAALMSAECHQWLSGARKDISSARTTLARAIRLSQQAELEGQEPVIVEAVAITREDDDECLRLEWLLEGGIAALELPGTLLLVAHGAVTDDEGSGEVYTRPVPAAQAGQVPEGFALVPDHPNADAIVTALYRRFKEWSARGFGPEDVTWCEVKADLLAMIAAAPQPEGGDRA